MVSDGQELQQGPNSRAEDEESLLDGSQRPSPSWNQADTGQDTDRTSSQASAVFNLGNTIVGAGIMSLPHAMAVLGLAFGTLLLLLIYWLAYYTLKKLVKYSEKLGATSYPQLVQTQLGTWGNIYLQLSIILNNAGIMTVYLIILGDITVGSAPLYGGLLSTWFGLDAGSTWYLSRPFVAMLRLVASSASCGTFCQESNSEAPDRAESALMGLLTMSTLRFLVKVAVLTLAFLLPICLLRRLDMLGGISAVSLSLAVMFSAISIALGIYAATQHGLSGIAWWPEWSRPTSVLATLPILTTSYVCAFNLHPLMRDLKDYTTRRMLTVLEVALGICTATYALAGIGCYLLFDGRPSDDVLKDFTQALLAPLLGPSLAGIVDGLVRAAYLLVLMGTFPMLCFGLREVFIQQCFKGPVGAAAWSGLTLAIISATYLVSVLVPSVWTALSITGATAALSLAYIIPAMLILKIDASVSERVLAVFIIVLGAITAVVAVADTLMQR